MVKTHHRMEQQYPQPEVQRLWSIRSDKIWNSVHLNTELRVHNQMEYRRIYEHGFSRQEKQNQQGMYQRCKLHYSDRDLTMKFWRLIGFITTGGPAVRGQAWNFLSVSSNHSLRETVWGVVPGYQINNFVKLHKDWLL